MPRKKSDSREAETTKREIFTITLRLGKRQFNRLVELGKPFGMTAEEAGQSILPKFLGAD